MDALSLLTSNSMRIRIVSALLGVFSILLFSLGFFHTDSPVCLSAHAILSKGTLIKALFAPLVDSNIFLIILNAIILSLFENSLHKVFQSTPSSSSAFRFFTILCTLHSLFIIARLIFGYSFFYGMGWSHPNLFFSTSWHECSVGLFPILFEFLIFESLLTTEKYYFSGVIMQKSTVHALLCGFSFLLSQRDSFWYNLSSIAVGLVVIVCTFLMKEGFFHKTLIILRDIKQTILSLPFFSNQPNHSPLKSTTPTQNKYTLETSPNNHTRHTFETLNQQTTSLRNVSITKVRSLENISTLELQNNTPQNSSPVIPNSISAFTPVVEKSRKRAIANSADSLETPSQSQIYVDMPDGPPSLKEKFSQGTFSFALQLTAVFSLLLYIRLFYTNAQSTQIRNTIIDTSPHLVRMMDFSENSQFLTVLIPTVPRPEKERHLIHTLQGLLDQWPEEEYDFFYNKLSIRVYSPPSNPVFDEAKELFSLDKKGQHYIHWVQILTPIPKKIQTDLQELAKEVVVVSEKEKKTLQEANSRARNRRMMKHRMEMLEDALLTNSSYIMLLEDDFVLCENGWNYLLFTIDSIMSGLPNHCGIFVATGGSGLIFTRYSTPLVIESLLFANESTPDIPSDIVMQKCVRGSPKSICEVCKNNLGVSSEMIFGHIGGNSSTVDNKYVDDEWQCGWRQVFNGEEDIFVIDIR